MKTRHCTFLFLLFYGIYGQTTTNNPTSYPTVDLIGTNSTENDLFIVPNIELGYSEATIYCKTRYHGLANIYDPNENRMILQLVNLNFISNAYIGYFKEDSEWKWQSNISSDPMRWLQSPLIKINTNIQDPTTNCMLITRFGWKYTKCSKSIYFVCETRDHSPQFIESGPFLLSQQKLKFDDARSLCRAQYYDLATIYEEEEYKVTQSLCADNTNGKTNCWIGYRRGILNENEWDWVQNIPQNVTEINELINTDLWSTIPWQISTAHIYCQATSNLTILYSSNGNGQTGNTSGEFTFNKSIKYVADNVLYESYLEFIVGTKPNSLPGLKCSIHFEDDIYNTKAGDYVYWSITSSTSGTDSSLRWRARPAFRSLGTSGKLLVASPFRGG